MSKKGIHRFDLYLWNKAVTQFFDDLYNKENLIEIQFKHVKDVKVSYIELKSVSIFGALKSTKTVMPFFPERYVRTVQLFQTELT